MRDERVLEAAFKDYERIIRTGADLELERYPFQIINSSPTVWLFNIQSIVCLDSLRTEETEV